MIESARSYIYIQAIDELSEEIDKTYPSIIIQKESKKSENNRFTSGEFEIISAGNEKLLKEKENILTLYTMIKNTIEDYEKENDDISMITSNVLYFGNSDNDFYCIDILYNIHSYRTKKQITKTPNATVKYIDNLEDINLIVKDNEDKKFKLSRLSKGTFFD